MHPEKRAKKKELVEMFTLLIMVHSIMDDSSSFHSSEMNGLCLMKLCLVQNLKFATVLK